MFEVRNLAFMQVKRREIIAKKGLSCVPCQLFNEETNITCQHVNNFFDLHFLLHFFCLSCLHSSVIKSRIFTISKNTSLHYGKSQPVGKVTFMYKAVSSHFDLNRPCGREWTALQYRLSSFRNVPGVSDPLLWYYLNTGSGNLPPPESTKTAPIVPLSRTDVHPPSSFFPALPFPADTLIQPS